MKKLHIAQYIPDTDCLGFGKRFTLWVQGCNKNCKGCIAQSLRSHSGGYFIEAEKLAEEIIKSDSCGITISGGEPFLQAENLAYMLELVKKKRNNIGVIVYTGYLFEELKKSPESAKFLEYADILIDGEYIENLDDNKSMRGSANQRVIFLTDRYNSSDMPGTRKNKIVFYDNKFMMIGIPLKSTKQLMDIMQRKQEE